MLRGRSADSNPAPGAPGIQAAPGAARDFPGVDRAYSVEANPVGVCFYVAKESFFRPYHLLQSMRYQAERLTLNFAADDVIIEGCGLHALYWELARQNVGQIVEQGERYAETSEAAVCVSRIMVIAQKQEE